MIGNTWNLGRSRPDMIGNTWGVGLGASMIGNTNAVGNRGNRTGNRRGQLKNDKPDPKLAVSRPRPHLFHCCQLSLLILSGVCRQNAKEIGRTSNDVATRRIRMQRV